MNNEIIESQVKELVSYIQSTYNVTMQYKAVDKDEEVGKKEIIVGHKDGPMEYDRTYPIYYPYGARFDTQILIQAGIALSALMDTARDLSPSAENQEKLELIDKKQKQIIDLFLNGTKDPNAIMDIMSDENLHLSPISKTIKIAKYKKDYLPYFSDPLFADFKKLKEYQKEQAAKKQKEKD